MRFGRCVLVLTICSSAALSQTLVPAVSLAAEDEKAGAAKSDAAKPDTTKPEAVKPGPGKPGITSLPRLPADLHNDLQGRDFANAVKLIDSLAAKQDRTDVDCLLYLKGLALLNLGQLDAALENFARLEKAYPQSTWLSRSRFGRGAALARQRNYQAAAAIYKAEAERLLSNGRKYELTGIYLESADRFFEGEVEKGPSTRKQPDYNQALTFYTQALQLKPSLPVRQRIELRIARCHQELNQLPQAIEAYRNFLNAYTGRKIHAAQKKFGEAIAAWREFLEKYPSDPNWSNVQRVIIDTEYAMAEEQRIQENYAAARKSWETFLNKYPLDGRAAFILLLFGQMEFDEAVNIVVQGN